MFAYGLVDAAAIQIPVFSCLVKIHNGLTCLVWAYPDCPGNEAIDAYLVK